MALFLGLATCLLHPLAGQAYTWRTHVGSSGGPGVNDGFGAEVHFSAPQGVAAADSGVVYVADTNNHSIRKIAPDGQVSTFAGKSGTSGSANGPVSEARFNGPAGVAVDADGTVYVSESTGHAIRKITPDGIVSTFAGSPGQSGSTNGTGAEARFNGPRGLALDPQGSLLVADTLNHVIRKITPDGVTSTFAGLAGTIGSADGSTNDARFGNPRALTAAADGTIYVADAANHLIRQISTDGMVSTLAGLAGQLGTTDGSGSSARFRTPSGICFDSEGNLRVAEIGSGLLRKVTLAGQVSTIGAGQLVLNWPASIAVTPSGDMVIPEMQIHAVSRVNSEGVRTVLGGSAREGGSSDGTGTSARLKSPQGVAARADGSLAIADTINYTIRRVTPDGSVTTAAGSPGSNGTADGTGSTARFYTPGGVAFGNNGIILVADTGNEMIRSISASGQVSTLAGQPGSLPPTDKLLAVPCLATAPDGSLMFGEGHNLRKLSSSGVASFVAGQRRLVTYAPTGEYVIFWKSITINQGNGDGVGTDAYMSVPGLCVDAQGTTYFADSRFHTIRKCSPAGSVTTLIGEHHTAGTSDGSVAQARFKAPRGIARDSAGNLYIADTGNHTIRHISPQWNVTTIGGLPGYGGNGEGTGSSAQFDTPSSIAMDGDGFLYVADTNNHRIARGVPPNHPEIEVEDAVGSLLVSGSGSLAFGQVMAGETATQVLTIRNPGTASVNLSNIRFVGGSGFAVDAGSFPTSIPPEESRTLAVRFAPGSAGIRTTSLYLDSNDANEASFRVDLSGTGLNRPPVFAGYSFGTPFGQAATVSVTKLLGKASDPDGDPLLLSSAAPLLATQGSAAIQGQQLIYTPAAGFTGEDRFQVTISDPNGGSVSGTVTVTVAPPEQTGTTATNPPRVEMQADGKIAVKFHGIPGRTYGIERSPDMNVWQPLSPATAGPNGLIEFIDENPLSPQGFYRLITP